MSPILILLLLIVNLSNGVPLESPSEDASHFFSRIVGGEDAPKAFAPHMAALVISDIIKMFTCGGSIISNRHVLTAAHCIDMFVISGELLPTFHVIVGTNDWYHKGIEARIAEFHIHPQWDPQPIKYDIGILALKEELQMSKRVGVIALNFNWVGGGEDSYVTGWGRLDTWGIVPYKLQLLFVRTLSQEQCMKLLLEVPGAETFPPTLKEEIEICAFHSVQHGMCFGDSGSALVDKKSNQQTGITSWSPYPCARGFPDVFVRISAYKDYVTAILNKKID